MRLFRQIAAAVRGIFHKDEESHHAGDYQLWLEDLGPNLKDVMDFIIEDFIVHTDFGGPDDTPDLPWMMLELPAGSDTFSLVSIHASQLQKLGAVVSVREV